VGTTDDRTFFLLWIRVIRLPYLATYEPSNPMCMRRARVLPTQAAFRVSDRGWKTGRGPLHIGVRASSVIDGAFGGYQSDPLIL